MPPPTCSCDNGFFEELNPADSPGQEFCAACLYHCRTCSAADTCDLCEGGTPVFR